jgi:hypothetical protein
VQSSAGSKERRRSLLKVGKKERRALHRVCERECEGDPLFDCRFYYKGN